MRVKVVSIGKEVATKKAEDAAISVNVAKLELEGVKREIIAKSKELDSILSQTLEAMNEFAAKQDLLKKMDIAVTERHDEYHKMDTDIALKKRELDSLNADVAASKKELEDSKNNIQIESSSHKEILAGIEMEKGKAVDEVHSELESLTNEINGKKDQLDAINNAIIAQNKALQNVWDSIKEKTEELRIITINSEDLEKYFGTLKEKIKDTLESLRTSDNDLVQKKKDLEIATKAVIEKQKELFSLSARLMAITKREEKMNMVASYLTNEAKRIGVTIKVPE